MRQKCQHSLNLLNFSQLKNRLIPRTTPVHFNTENILSCFTSCFMNHRKSQGREKRANMCTQTTLLFKKVSPFALETEIMEINSYDIHSIQISQNSKTATPLFQ